MERKPPGRPATPRSLTLPPFHLQAHLSPADLAEAARLTELQRSTNERIEAVERAAKEALAKKEREELEALLAAEAAKAEKERLAEEWVAAQAPSLHAAWLSSEPSTPALPSHLLPQERQAEEAKKRKEDEALRAEAEEEKRVLAERERVARELAERQRREEQEAASQQDAVREAESGSGADLSRREKQLEQREAELEELIAGLRASGAEVPAGYTRRAAARSTSKGYRSRSRGRSRPRGSPGGKWAPLVDEPNDSEPVPLLNGLLLAQDMPLEQVLRLLHRIEANVRRIQHESGNEFTLNFGPEGFFMG